jgi:hypothetical protein
MRVANICAGLAAAVWFAVALNGRDGMDRVVAQKVLGYPNMGQIDLYLVWPFLVLAAILALAWACNTFGRWFAALGSLSVVTIVSVLPYCVIARGGV